MAETLDRPHFAIIGAMKCATSTLHDQLARQPGVFMSEPKEPNFFSDDDRWARGVGWYRSLFEAAPGGALCGESSTHYTKLPTHPLAAGRMHDLLPHARLVYVMRDPIDRLVSQYVHEWSQGRVSDPIDAAVQRNQELIAYSMYAMQLRPWLNRYGPARILPVFFERLTVQPQAEFARIGAFLGLPEPAVWRTDLDARNRSSERIRRTATLNFALKWGPTRALRRMLVPVTVRERIKARLRMDSKPVLSQAARAWCAERLNPDLAELSGWLGLPLSCDGFRSTVLGPDRSPGWALSEAPA